MKALSLNESTLAQPSVLLIQLVVPDNTLAQQNMLAQREKQLELTNINSPQSRLVSIFSSNDCKASELSDFDFAQRVYACSMSLHNFTE